MHLFERVRKIAKYFTGSDKALAEKLGFKQQTFCSYFNEKRQDNLWPVLPKILALFPTIQRDWLYFGEGTMLKDSPPTDEAPQSEGYGAEPGSSVNDKLTQLERKNTELIEKLFATKDELLETKNDLLAAKDKIIALQEEMGNPGIPTPSPSFAGTIRALLPKANLPLLPLEWGQGRHAISNFSEHWNDVRQDSSRQP